MAIATLTLQLVIEDATGVPVAHEPGPKKQGVTYGKRERITLTASAFTALSPPTSAKAVLVILGTATSLTWKGVTGDTGTTIEPSSSPTGWDLFMPLGATPSCGIANGLGSSQTVDVIWIV